MDARTIIQQHGGIRPLARKLGHENPTTVQGWWIRNNIPEDRRPEVAALPAESAAA